MPMHYNKGRSNPLSPKGKAFATCSRCKTKAACKKAGRCALKSKSKK